jgi:hypothetical protein
VLRDRRDVLEARISAKVARLQLLAAATRMLIPLNCGADEPPPPLTSAQLAELCRPFARGAFLEGLRDDNKTWRHR